MPGRYFFLALNHMPRAIVAQIRMFRSGTLLSLGAMVAGATGFQLFPTGLHLWNKHFPQVVELAITQPGGSS